MAIKVIGSVRSALGACYGLTRHVVWYVSYHIDGTAREQTADTLRRS